MFCCSIELQVGRAMLTVWKKSANPDKKGEEQKWKLTQSFAPQVELFIQLKTTAAPNKKVRHHNPLKNYCRLSKTLKSKKRKSNRQLTNISMS